MILYDEYMGSKRKSYRNTCGCWHMARSIRETCCRICLFRGWLVFCSETQKKTSKARINDIRVSAWSKQKLQLSIGRISDTDKSISTLEKCLICKPTFPTVRSFRHFTVLYIILRSFSANHCKEWKA